MVECWFRKISDWNTSGGLLLLIIGIPSDTIIIRGVIHIVRRHKGGGGGGGGWRGGVKPNAYYCVQGGGWFKIAYVRKKNCFGPQNLKTFLFLYKKSYYIAIYYCIYYCNVRMLNSLYTTLETFIIFEQNTILPFKYVSKMFLKSSLLISSAQFLIHKRI